jgi:hypothetical protein
MNSTNLLVFLNPHAHTDLNEKDASRIHFRILLAKYQPASFPLEYPELNSILNTIQTRKYTKTLRDEHRFQNLENSKEENLQMLRNDVGKLMEILSKTLNTESNQYFEKHYLTNTEDLICQVLDFIQVHFHHEIICEKVPEDLTESELQFKLILNLCRAKALQIMAWDFLAFIRNSSNQKKISEMDVPSIYQYYKDGVESSTNEFKKMYQIVLKRNDNLPIWLKNRLYFTSMIKDIDGTEFSTKWEEVRKIYSKISSSKSGMIDKTLGFILQKFSP